uniref:Nucleoporin NUP35 n=1 Tax=Heterorhabditis bacteriophora TaxID=37862 RepID=A0A1I7XK27_HETBA
MVIMYSSQLSPVCANSSMGTRTPDFKYSLNSNDRLRGEATDEVGIKTPSFLFGQKRRSLAVGTNSSYLNSPSTGPSAPSADIFASPLPNHLREATSGSAKSVHWSPSLVQEKSHSSILPNVASPVISQRSVTTHNPQVYGSPAINGPPLRSLRDEIEPVRKVARRSVSVPLSNTVDVSNIEGQSIRTSEEIGEGQTWVTVFGFPSEQVGKVLKYFSRHGEIVSHQIPSCGNWMHIRYSCPVHARQALSRNATIMDGSIRIGVVPCTEKDLVGSDLNRSITVLNRYVNTDQSIEDKEENDDTIPAIASRNENINLMNTSNSLQNSMTSRSGMRSLSAAYYNSQDSKNRVVVWRLPADVSQSRLGGRKAPSNACTLIAIRLAEVIHRTNTNMPHPKDSTGSLSFSNIGIFDIIYPETTSQRASAGTERLTESETISDEQWETVVSFLSIAFISYVAGNQPCPTAVMTCVTEAILEGNELHEEAVIARQGRDQNFTIPDAIKACQNTFKEIDFCSVRGSIQLHLPRYIRTVINNPYLLDEPRVYMVMIAFERTVLIVYERTTATLTLFDSHMHGTSEGALIASCRVIDLPRLSEWITLNIFPETYMQTTASSQEFEISVIRFCGVPAVSDCCPPALEEVCECSIFAAPRPRRALKRPAPTTVAIYHKQMTAAQHIPLVSIENLLDRSDQNECISNIKLLQLVCDSLVPNSLIV